LNSLFDTISERAVILAPQGRDALVAAGILREGGLAADICNDLHSLTEEIAVGAGMAVLTDDAIRNADIKNLAAWVNSQPPWSDFPFVLLTERGGGLERNPGAARQTQALGNVIFLERPFHPTTLISVARTALRGRLRQYDARARLEALRESEAHARQAEASLRGLNENLEARVGERTAELAATNRQLVAQIEEREKVETTLRQMQRLEAIGQLTSGVAHDFNNLLTVVLGNIGFLEKLKSAVADAKFAQRLAHMRLATERGAKLTSQLLAFSRRQRLEPKPFDVNEALVNMRDLLQSTLGGSIVIDTAFQSGIWPALADPTQIELVVLNLAINSRDAMPDGGTVTIATANARLGPPEKPEEPPAGDYVMIAVTDAGTGMTKDVLTKALEPFFTTKEIGKGSGLGLSQVLGFAKQSGGGMRIETRVGEGTSVKVYLPRASANSISEAPAVAAGAALNGGRGATILLVDDDSAVRDVTATLLEDLGYITLKVGSGGAALDVLDRRNDIDLALIDFAMPGMSGVEVARQVQLKYRTLPILFVTGYADKVALADVGDERIIKKPFVGDELAEKVNAALVRSRSRASSKVVVPLRR
jgi:signal transduction histidine kinase/ActR/RegA family two-component response regulator